MYLRPSLHPDMQSQQKKPSYEGWFDPSPNISKKPISVKDILDVVYDAISEMAYERVYQEETKEQYDDDIKQLVSYPQNKKSQQAYQCYKNAYLAFTVEKKARKDSTVNVANFLNHWKKKQDGSGSLC